MKKFILGIIIGATLFVPVGVRAWDREQSVKPIYYVPDESGSAKAVVHVFDDQNNKCYTLTASYNAEVSISCVKKGE